MESFRQRVLVTTRNYPPLTGGMERLIHHVQLSLSRFARVSLVGPSGCDEFAVDTERVIGVRIKPLWFFLVANFFATLVSAIVWRPKIVFSGSGLTAPAAVIAAKVCRAKSGSYVHGLDVIANHWLYRAAFAPFIRHLDFCVANSTAVGKMAVAAGVSYQRLHIINPGVGGFPASRLEFRAMLNQKYNLAQKKVLLSVGRLTARKGLTEFLARAYPIILEKTPETVLLIVGEDPQNALLNKRGGYKQDLEELVLKIGISEKVVFVGNIPDEDLSAIYEMADLHVFPVIDIPGDIEGFGMVAVEAAHFGCPTVAFDVGGVSDAVAQNISGSLVPSGKYDEFASAVNSALENKSLRESSKEFSKQFEWDRFGEKLESVVRQYY